MFFSVIFRVWVFSHRLNLTRMKNHIIFSHWSCSKNRFGKKVLFFCFFFCFFSTFFQWKKIKRLQIYNYRYHVGLCLYTTIIRWGDRLERSVDIFGDKKDLFLKITEKNIEKFFQISKYRRSIFRIQPVWKNIYFFHLGQI